MCAARRTPAPFPPHNVPPCPPPLRCAPQRTRECCKSSTRAILSSRPYRYSTIHCPHHRSTSSPLPFTSPIFQVTQRRVTSTVHTIVPQPGLLVICPAYAQHEVQPVGRAHASRRTCPLPPFPRPPLRHSRPVATAHASASPHPLPYPPQVQPTRGHSPRISLAFDVNMNSYRGRGAAGGLQPKLGITHKEYQEGYPQLWPMRFPPIDEIPRPPKLVTVAPHGLAVSDDAPRTVTVAANGSASQ